MTKSEKTFALFNVIMAEKQVYVEVITINNRQPLQKYVNETFKCHCGQGLSNVCLLN